MKTDLRAGTVCQFPIVLSAPFVFIRGFTRLRLRFKNISPPFGLLAFASPGRNTTMASADPSPPRDEQIAAVLSSPPPRKLTPSLRRAALRQSVPLSYAIFGLLFGGFGLHFVLVYFPWHFIGDLKLRQSDTAETDGRIMAMAKTRVPLNGKDIVQFAFDFKTPAGDDVHGVCYTTGRRWIPGDPVPVRYRPENPQIACPVEGRLSRFPMTFAAVILFPLFGGGLVAWVMLARRRSLSLLKHGLALKAIVVDLEHTQTETNDYPIYKATFQREDLPRNPPIQSRHWEPKVVAFLQSRLQSKQPVYVICDPSKPDRCLLPEAL
jgi:hypothetical protein